jgi:hypothetical protein
MLRAFENCAETVLLTLDSTQWCYQKVVSRGGWGGLGGGT